MKKFILVFGVMFISFICNAGYDIKTVNANGVEYTETATNEVEFENAFYDSFHITADVTVYKNTASSAIAIANSVIYLTNSLPDINLYAARSTTGSTNYSTTPSCEAEGYYLYAYVYVTPGSTGVAKAEALIEW